MSKQSLTWHTEKKVINALVPFSKNPRTIGEAQLEALKNSLKKFNVVELPAIDADGTVVAGHQRLKALQLLGRGNEEIEVRVPNRKLTKREFEQYLLTSNAVRGDWAYELLRTFDTELLLTVGFKDEELAHLWDDIAEVEDDEFNIDRELEKIKKPKTKLGDVITLGPHKLICGDATDAAILKKLFGSEKASMIYSDPVYNLKGGVSYAKGVGGHANYGATVNDTRSDPEYKEFLRESIVNALAVAKDDTHVFYYCDQSYVWLLQTLYAELGIHNKRVCLWVKNGQNPTPDVAFSKCYEPAVYGVRGKPFLARGLQSFNEIQNKELSSGNRLIDDILDQLDLWLVRRLPGTEYTHATAKPPTLHEKAIRRCTRPGDIILDSFAGSGSTLVAAHQLKRRAYLVELEPVFCDLIVARYKKLTQ